MCLVFEAIRLAELTLKREWKTRPIAAGLQYEKAGMVVRSNVSVWWGMACFVISADSYIFSFLAQNVQVFRNEAREGVFWWHRQIENKLSNVFWSCSGCTVELSFSRCKARWGTSGRSHNRCITKKGCPSEARAKREIYSRLPGHGESEGWLKSTNMHGCKIWRLYYSILDPELKLDFSVSKKRMNKCR